MFTHLQPQLNQGQQAAYASSIYAGHSLNGSHTWRTDVSNDPILLNISNRMLPENIRHEMAERQLKLNKGGIKFNEDIVYGQQYKDNRARWKRASLGEGPSSVNVRHHI